MLILDQFPFFDPPPVIRTHGGTLFQCGHKFFCFRIMSGKKAARSDHAGGHSCSGHNGKHEAHTSKAQLPDKQMPDSHKILRY